MRCTALITASTQRAGLSNAARAKPQHEYHQAVCQQSTTLIGATRRAVLVGTLTATASVLLQSATATAVQSLGQETSSSASSSEQLSIDEVKTRLQRTFEEDQYYVNGNLDRSIFAPDCLFLDPTVRVRGVQPYSTAVANLFVADKSRADIISIAQQGDNAIVLRWRLEGVLRLGSLAIKPYTGTTTYTVGRDGRIVEQREEWDISAIDAFVSCFFPSFGAAPASSIDVLRRAATA